MVYLHMHSLQTNYKFTIIVIHCPYLKTTSKTIPLNQHKLKKLEANLLDNSHMSNRANLCHHVLIQANMMPILNVTNSLQ